MDAFTEPPRAVAPNPDPPSSTTASRPSRLGYAVNLTANAPPSPVAQDTYAVGANAEGQQPQQGQQGQPQQNGQQQQNGQGQPQQQQANGEPPTPPRHMRPPQDQQGYDEYGGTRGDGNHQQMRSYQSGGPVRRRRAFVAPLPPSLPSDRT